MRVNVAKWINNRQRWQINVQKYGIRKTFTSSKKGRTGQRECHKKADEWLNDNIDNNQNCNTIFIKWYIELKLITSLVHYNKTLGIWNTWYKKTIGHLKIKDITEQHLQNIVNNAYKKGRVKKTLMNIRYVGIGFVKYCRKSNLTALVPENVIVPRNAKINERNILQPSDIKKLFSSNKTIFKDKEIEEFYINAYRFMVLTGLRPGELVGLQWQDFHYNYFEIQRSINIKNEITKGKNKNANRLMPLNNFTGIIVNEQKLLYNGTYGKTDFVFPNQYKDFIKQQNLYHRWKKYQLHNGITPQTTLYELRHTFISTIKSLPIGLIKPIVGHSSSMDTQSVYSHNMDGELAVTSKLIENIFANVLQK